MEPQKKCFFCFFHVQSVPGGSLALCEARVSNNVFFLFFCSENCNDVFWFIL